MHPLPPPPAAVVVVVVVVDDGVSLSALPPRLDPLFELDEYEEEKEDLISPPVRWYHSLPMTDLKDLLQNITFLPLYLYFSANIMLLGDHGEQERRKQDLVASYHCVCVCVYEWRTKIKDRIQRGEETRTHRRRAMD